LFNGKLNRRSPFSSTSRWEKMKVHPGLKPALWGAVVGAVGIAIVGFSALGWTLDSTADRMANELE
jgi:hypothetical protein